MRQETGIERCQQQHGHDDVEGPHGARRRQNRPQRAAEQRQATVDNVSLHEADRGLYE